MTCDEIAQLYRDSLNVFGQERELVQMMEECGELIQSCSKVIRAGDRQHTLASLAEELADVQLMVDKITYELDLGEAVDANLEFKLRRLRGQVDAMTGKTGGSNED